MDQEFTVYSVRLRQITRLAEADQGNARVLLINLVAGVCVEAQRTGQ